MLHAGPLKRLCGRLSQVSAGGVRDGLPCGPALVACQEGLRPRVHGRAHPRTLRRERRRGGRRDALGLRWIVGKRAIGTPSTFSGLQPLSTIALLSRIALRSRRVLNLITNLLFMTIRNMCVPVLVTFRRIWPLLHKYIHAHTSS